MVGREINLPGHGDRLGFRLNPVKLNAMLGLAELAAVEGTIEVEMPPRSAELAVSDRLQPDLLLFAHDRPDLAVFDLPQPCVVEPLFCVCGARGFDHGGPEKATDHVGTKRRLCAWHCVVLPAAMLHVNRVLRCLTGSRPTCPFRRRARI